VHGVGGSFSNTGQVPWVFIDQPGKSYRVAHPPRYQVENRVAY